MRLNEETFEQKKRREFKGINIKSGYQTMRVE